jgi:hypothetical protein
MVLFTILLFMKVCQTGTPTSFYTKILDYPFEMKK